MTIDAIADFADHIEKHARDDLHAIELLYEGHADDEHLVDCTARIVTDAIREADRRDEVASAKKLIVDTLRGFTREPEERY